jgi:hypothetical protein
MYHFDYVRFFFIRLREERAARAASARNRFLSN